MLKPTSAKETVTEGMRTLLREQSEAAAFEGKTQLATQVLGLARAVRRGSDQLYEDELMRLARLGDVLADELEAAGIYLEGQGSRELLEDLSRLLRQRTGLVVGSAVLAGFCALYLVPRLRQRRSWEGRRHGY